MIGEDLSARAHEIRDVLTCTSVPFGFHARDSAEGQAALERLGVGEPAGPVVALYNGAVLVDPSNAEVGAALGVDIRPAELTYDLVIVGAGATPALLTRTSICPNRLIATSTMGARWELRRCLCAPGRNGQ